MSRPTRVAVIDSGFDRAFPHASVVAGVGIASREKPFEVALSGDDLDVEGHGTSCTHILLAANPDVEIVPVRVFGARLEASPAVLLAALSWAVEVGEVDVINLSLGTRRNDAARALYAACSAANEMGVAIVASADNRTDDGYPAMFDTVIGVGAGHPHRPLTMYLDEAPECRGPVQNIKTIGLGGRPRTVSGTSFIAPLVSARVARLHAAGVRGAASMRRALATGSGEATIGSQLPEDES